MATAQSAGLEWRLQERATLAWLARLCHATTPSTKSVSTAGSSSAMGKASHRLHCRRDPPALPEGEKEPHATNLKQKCEVDKKTHVRIQQNDGHLSTALRALYLQCCSLLGSKHSISRPLGQFLQHKRHPSSCQGKPKILHSLAKCML